MYKVITAFQNVENGSKNIKKLKESHREQKKPGGGRKETSGIFWGKITISLKS